MHIRSNTFKSKSEAMFPPTSLNQARLEVLDDVLPEDLTPPNEKKVLSIHKFKYFGSIITPPPK
jgi:hypothetical protein